MAIVFLNRHIHENYLKPSLCCHHFWVKHSIKKKVFANYHRFEKSRFDIQISYKTHTVGYILYTNKLLCIKIIKFQFI